MGLRDDLTQAMKDAMRAGDKTRLGVVRLLLAALKDRDIEARGLGREPLPEEDVLALLAKQRKQRRESIEMYEKAGRPELAEAERAEDAVIASFMPAAMDEAAVDAAVAEAVATTGAASVKDMGRVMAKLREAYAGRMDFGAAGPKVKRALGG